MNSDRSSIRAFPYFLRSAALGAVFALCLYPVWGLEGRWFVIVIVAIALVSISMIFAGRFSGFLFILLLFCVPLAGFAKWIVFDDYPEDVRLASLTTGTLGIGLTDFLIAGLYGAWAFRIFLLREEPLPRLEKVDAWVALLALSYVLSLWGADLRLGILAIAYLLRYILVYFYVSRHFKRRHVRWFVGAIAFAIVVESVIGILQYGQVVPPGLILDKGAGSDRLELHYDVSGVEEGVIRATGTTYDSHALGTYLAMLVPFFLVFLYDSAWSVRLRLASGALLLVGFVGLVLTYSRSAWLSFAISLGVPVLVLIAWRERYVLTSAICVAVAGLITAPWVFFRVFARFFEADPAGLAARFDQYPTAWAIWRDHFLFGSGAGSYMVMLYQQNFNWAEALPVHNVLLFIGAELGFFGVVAYYGLIVVVLRRLWRLVRLRHEPDYRLALAAFAGLSQPYK